MGKLLIAVCCVVLRQPLPDEVQPTAQSSRSTEVGARTELGLTLTVSLHKRSDGELEVVWVIINDSDHDILVSPNFIARWYFESEELLLEEAFPPPDELVSPRLFLLLTPRPEALKVRDSVGCTNAVSRRMPIKPPSNFAPLRNGELKLVVGGKALRWEQGKRRFTEHEFVLKASIKLGNSGLAGAAK